MKKNDIIKLETGETVLVDTVYDDACCKVYALVDKIIAKIVVETKDAKPASLEEQQEFKQAMSKLNLYCDGENVYRLPQNRSTTTIR